MPAKTNYDGVPLSGLVDMLRLHADSLAGYTYDFDPESEGFIEFKEALAATHHAVFQGTSRSSIFPICCPPAAHTGPVSWSGERGGPGSYVNCWVLTESNSPVRFCPFCGKKLKPPT